MYKISFLGITFIASLGLTACVSNTYTHPLNLRFQDNQAENNQRTLVKRDEILCAGDTKQSQNCPIELYIDSIKSGSFYINNSANYQLKPQSYNFKVKNCTENSCLSCDIDLNINQLENNQLVLSLDDTGKPFISRNGSRLICNVPSKVAQSKELTLTIDLVTDTLLKFNGSILNEFLLKGHQEALSATS